MANPARIREWLAALTNALRRDLGGRADTQVLLGDRVVVTARSGTWARVVVPDQPTPLDARGYPGWVPLVQLSATRPSVTGRTATVVSRTAWLRSDDGRGLRVLEASFGTRLPVIATTGDSVRVAVPSGRVLRLALRDASVTVAGAPALPATGPDVVRAATMFTGLPYLWAGSSGFGFDCSGLVWLDMRVHGVTIARDAGPQSVRGRAVASSERRAGDLLFFARAGVVHHVGVYAGGGIMVHAPGTGLRVETIALTTEPYADELVATRRYLG